MDAAPALAEDVLTDLVRYLRCFLCVEVEVAEVPELPIAPKGWQALHERLRHPLRNRPGRPGSGIERQLCAPHLLECLKGLKRDPVAVEVPAAEGAACVLGFTACELFRSTEGLLPDEAVPEERTRAFSVAAARASVGAVSIAHLEGRLAKEGPPRRKFMRQLMTLVSHSFLELLHLRSCQSHQCLAYHRAFDPENTSMNMCYQCEDALIRLTRPRGEKWEDMVMAAADRYRDIGETLQHIGSNLERIKLSRRSYAEFEEDCDWLQVAEEILRESAAERRRRLPEAPEGTSRRRSLLACLRCAHEQQPHVALKRTFTQPLLKRTCLVDMAQSAPYRHECGELAKWTIAVTNRRHEAGGHYVELGGSLRQKKIGSFIDAGLNASLARSGQERLKSTMAQMPLTWKEQRVGNVIELPKIRGRTRVLEK
uniref:Uncharacterized protein n=1 Tax=Zooxanthella nutricula TaxID=1333877 RepID=A0A7S2Q5K0_9DINO